MLLMDKRRRREIILGKISGLFSQVVYENIPQLRRGVALGEHHGGVFEQVFEGAEKFRGGGAVHGAVVG